MENLVNLYFDCWNSHNINDLKKLFDKSVILEDWENTFNGIDEVVQENNNLFKNFPTIRAVIADLGISDERVFAKIKVYLNGDDVIDVIDVFEFKDNKIVNIKAYKG